MLTGPHPDCHSTVVLHARDRRGTRGPDGRSYPRDASRGGGPRQLQGRRRGRGEEMCVGRRLARGEHGVASWTDRIM